MSHILLVKGFNVICSDLSFGARPSFEFRMDVPELNAENIITVISSVHAPFEDCCLRYMCVCLQEVLSVCDGNQ